jgi:Tol biopolymer transport system component
MTLSAGSRIGPYEIVAPLGAGGMGEVYLAHDVRLERRIALKVLPTDRCASADARQRFEREARIISRLSHPNICALYDVGRHDAPQGPIDYLVMEYLEGETLSDRLEKGALPLEQTLRFGIEIADALHKAHGQGVVHRDLKPANVMLTKTGVKLLDFGLAKSGKPLIQGGSLTAAPTRAELTQEGAIIGTLQYMAPEQLEGKETDARTDIFALGAVLYEMATGRKAFSGTNQASLISSIMKEEPEPIARIRQMTPPAFDHAVETCLAKDPEERWQSANDLKSQLKWIAASGSRPGATAPVGTAPVGTAPMGADAATTRAASRGRRERLAWGVAGVAVLASILALGAFLRRGGPTPTPAGPMRFSINLSEMSALRSVELSPDGTHLVAVARDASGRNLLWLRPIDSLALVALPGTENPSYPFWSPDGRFIAYFADGKLKKIAVSGGPPQTICDAPLNRGGTWGPDGTIIFAPVSDGPLARVSSSGGTSTLLTQLNPTRGETTHRWPFFLPDGRHYLYLVASFATSTEQEKMGIYVRSLDSQEERFLLRANSSMAYAPPGYILFLRERNLYAQAFDARELRVSGDPLPVAEQIQYFPQIYKATFSVSNSGALLYQNQGGTVLGRLAWFDRGGRNLGFLGAPADQANPRISPDGKRVALSITDAQSGNQDIWAYESSGGIATRLTTHPGVDGTPIWSPDGTRIVFTSIRRGHADLYRMKSSGGGSEQPLFEFGRTSYASDWSPDGRFVLLRANDAQSNLELWTIPADGDHKPVPFIKTAFGVTGGRFSPDGRFVAYASNETGRWEIYVAPFPGPGGNWRVSSEGGNEPVWRRDGKELFYIAADSHLMTVPVKLVPTFDAGEPKSLFLVRRREPVATIDMFSYDVSADGQRFLVNTDAGESSTPPLTAILNWDAGLKR